jgi:hypothetical protein
MNYGKPIRLNDEYAAQECHVGLRIFPYFEDDGEICEDVRGGSVVLDDNAQLSLTDAICQRLGDCDKLKDSQAEAERLHLACNSAIKFLTEVDEYNAGQGKATPETVLELRGMLRAAVNG